MMVAEVVSVPLIFLSLHRQTSVVVCANFFSVWPASVRFIYWFHSQQIMTKLLLFLRRTSSLLVLVLFFYTVILFNCVISCLFSGVFVLASFFLLVFAV